ncbi:MAG: heme NO-binding domain-containing protein [Sphingorhabdus sp.]
MIHRGVRQMVIDQLGEDAWAAAEKKLGIGPTELVTGMVYEDSMTIEIIAEAAARLNLPVEDCLQEFGRYWVRFAERGSFGSFMDFTGQDLPSFIANLDRMHLAVATAMPKAQVPSFFLANQSPGRLEVEYRSVRTGLEKFVIGLLYGLMERFEIQGKVEILKANEQVVTFEIHYHNGN